MRQSPLKGIRRHLQSLAALSTISVNLAPVVGSALLAVFVALWQWSSEQNLLYAFLLALFALACALSIAVSLRVLSNAEENTHRSDAPKRGSVSIADIASILENVGGKSRSGDWGVELCGFSTDGYYQREDAIGSIQFSLRNYASNRAADIDVYLDCEVQPIARDIFRSKRTMRAHLKNSRDVNYINPTDSELYILASWNPTTGMNYWGDFRSDKPKEIGSDFAICSVKITVVAAARSKAEFALTIVVTKNDPPIIVVLRQPNHIHRQFDAAK